MRQVLSTQTNLSVNASQYPKMVMSSFGAQIVNVLEPGTVFGERFTQFDLRVTKIFGFARTTRLRTMVDFFNLFNLFNANYVTRENLSFGAAYLRPRVILPGRLMKVAFQFDF